MFTPTIFYKSHSSFGLDGAESIAEIRPGFSESPIDLTAKIKTIIDYGHDRQPELEFYSGHFQDNCSLGGHIHFGCQPEDKIIDALDLEGLKGRQHSSTDF